MKAEDTREELIKLPANTFYRKEAKSAKEIHDYYMTENEVATLIVDAALKVHRELGPGLFESTYEVCLTHELRNKGLEVSVQKELPVFYGNIQLEAGYRIDLLVEGIVIVELKSVQTVNDLHIAQILTYLKLSHCKLGLLINFNVKFIKDGIKRVANGI